MSVSFDNLNDHENLLMTQISEFANELTDQCIGKDLQYLLDNADALGLSDEFKNRLRECCAHDEYPGTALKDFVIKDYRNIDGLKAIALTDPDGLFTGFSFFGTDSNNPVSTVIDGIDDIVSSLTSSSIQIRWALEFFINNKSDNGFNYLFGHSHGAAICEAIFLKFEKEIKNVLLFNPQYLGGMSDDDLRRLNNDKISVIVNNGDGLTGGQSTLDNIRNRYGDNNVRVAGDFGKKINLLGLNYHGYNNTSFNPDGSVVSNTQIIVDTARLWDYGRRLEDVQKRYNELERKIQSYKNPFDSPDTAVLEAVGSLMDSFMSIFSNVNNLVCGSCISSELGKYASATFKVAEEFEFFEKQLANLKSRL